MTEDGRGERRADEGGKLEQDDEDAAPDRDLVALEADPDLLPVSAGLDGLDLAELRAGLCGDGAGEALGCPDHVGFVVGLRHEKVLEHTDRAGAADAATDAESDGSFVALALSGQPNVAVAMRPPRNRSHTSSEYPSHGASTGGTGGESTATPTGVHVQTPAVRPGCQRSVREG